jgi:hypothetical protein
MSGACEREVRSVYTIKSRKDNGGVTARRGCRIGSALACTDTGNQAGTIVVGPVRVQHLALPLTAIISGRTVSNLQ